MSFLYKIAKWSINKLIKKGIDLTNIVETDDLTKKIRIEAYSLNNDLIKLQDEYALKRVEIIELQNQLIVAFEPIILTFLAETNDDVVKTTMTKLWYDKMTMINKAVNEHEMIIADFTDKHEQLQKIETK